jgi:hypothetical protein
VARAPARAHLDSCEFRNTFNLDETLDSEVKVCGPIQLVDFNRAKAKSTRENSVDDPLRLQWCAPTVNLIN